MPATTEEALLLAIETREDLFGSLQEMLDSDNYLAVLMNYDSDLTQREIAEKAGVNQSTVSRAVNELRELELVETTEDGEMKSLPVLDHPIMQHFFETEVQQE